MYPSKRAYSPRAFDSFWKPIVRVFQVFGVANPSIFHAKYLCARSVYFVTVSVLHICWMIYTLKYGQHMHSLLADSNKKSQLMYYVSLMGLAGNLATHIVAHFEPLFTRKNEQEIYDKLREINDIFATKLNYVIDFNAIRKKFLSHTVVYFIFAGLLSVAYSILSIPDTDTFTMSFYVFTRLMSATIIRARRCLIAFHVNTLTNTLRDLQILLKEQQMNYRTKSSALVDTSSENIRYLRDIYSNVWILKNLISSCFGWSFITFLVEFSFELINSSYWTYLNIKGIKSKKQITSKLHGDTIRNALKIARKTGNKNMKRIFFSFTETVFYISSIIINFCYICMISERCERAVS